MINIKMIDLKMLIMYIENIYIMFMAEYAYCVHRVNAALLRVKQIEMLLHWRGKLNVYKHFK